MMITLMLLQSVATCLLRPTHAFGLVRSSRNTAAAEKFPPRSVVISLSSSEPSSSSEEDFQTIDETTRAEVRRVCHHITGQTLASLLAPLDAKAIANELLFDRDTASTLFNEEARALYVEYWERAEGRLRKEDARTPADFLGAELTARLLAAVRKSGGQYDPQTVLQFLESDAVNALFTRLLYDAIFEFTLKVDVIGNAIAKLPLLGPMRAQVVKESKRNLDRTLGPLLKNFLLQYTKVAVRQAAGFVVSEENAAAFGQANAKLLSYLLKQRTVAEWLPEQRVLVKLREEIWEYLAGLEGGGADGAAKDRRRIVEKSIDWTYELAGDKRLADGGVDVGAVLDASPTLERSLGALWTRCRDAADAK